MTLVPGDVIGSGTVPTCTLVEHLDPAALQSFPGWLRDGDVVTLQVEGLGETRQTVRPEKGDAKPTERRAFLLFFPFVSENPCLKWGLPKSFADFPSLLRQALRLSPGAQPLLLSTHQGEWEAEIARESYRGLGISVRKSRIEAEEAQGLWPSPHATYVMKADFEL